MKRRMISLLLALALLCTLAPQLTLPARAFSDIGGMLDWRFDESTGTLIITGYGYMADFEAERYDPQTNLTYPVTPWEVFAPQITSVVLPDGLMSIGINAFFNFTNLKSITIPNSVTRIGRDAFRACASLSKIDLPNSVTYIGSEAFSGCKSLQSIVIPNGVSHIYGATFRGCSSLRSVTIPNSVIDIRMGAFYGCTSLAGITIPDSVEMIEEYAFLDTAYYNNAGNWTDGLLYLGKWLIAAESGPSRVTVRPGTLGIAANVFKGHTPLMGVTLPEGLKSIGNSAFCDCYYLYYVNIPGSVKRIGYFAFDNTAMYHNAANWVGPIMYLGSWLVASRILEYDASYTIRPGTRGIADSALSNYHLILTNPVLPGSLQYIGCNSFFGSSRITSIVFPESVTYIGEGAFGWSEHLSSVVILNKNCGIYDDPYVFNNSSMTVVGYPGSTAEAYARKYGYPFKNVDELGFLDVDEGAYYSAPVDWASENGITTGAAPHIFSPDATCTRAQVVTFLWRAMGSPEPASSRNPFKDVPEGQYYYKAVLWAVEQGVTTGTSADRFSPDAGCTRAQVVTFLWRAEGSPAPESERNPFTDVKEDAYYRTPVLWAGETGITTGTSADKFSPDSTCTRGQIVTFLYRDLV